jgi:hypothetical protein
LRGAPDGQHFKKGIRMVDIRDGRLGKGVHAITDLARGEIVMSAWGTVSSVRTRHSIQIDTNSHLTVDNEMQFVNHSCEPNCGLMIRDGVNSIELHTLRTIAAGEELTIDYATFEDDIRHMTGSCLCGAPACRGQVTGYSELSAERKAALQPYIAQHLQRRDVLASRAG